MWMGVCQGALVSSIKSSVCVYKKAKSIRISTTDSILKVYTTPAYAKFNLKIVWLIVDVMAFECQKSAWCRKKNMAAMWREGSKYSLPAAQFFSFLNVKNSWMTNSYTNHLCSCIQSDWSIV